MLFLTPLAGEVPELSGADKGLIQLEGKGDKSAEDPWKWRAGLRWVLKFPFGYWKSFKASKLACYQNQLLLPEHISMVHQVTDFAVIP